MASGRNTSTIGAEFRKVVKGGNVFTPTIISYEMAGDYIVELSKGEAMDGSDQFGVTVVDRIAKEYRHDLSQLFHIRSEARKYINKLAQL